jgi:2,4-dienoyl-CoA reductase-like NADH-dependent reductase (Old Yellow Enzyme family)
MSALFSPLTLRGLTLRNRIAMAPMCQYSAVDGAATAWHMVHLGSRAVGGAGLVIAEMTAVSPGGRITPGCMGLWSDEQALAAAPIVKFIQDQGAAAGVQLAHAGRKGARRLPWDGGHPLDEGSAWTLIAPSALAFTGFALPQAMNTADMEKVLADFASAALRARRAGFDVVEIHMAHGYLLHQFLSPLSNVRTDRFGGSLRQRAAFPLEVARVVRDAWPTGLPVFVRLSCIEWVDGGFTLDQATLFSQWLKEIGVDLIDCSSGGNVGGERLPATPAYNLPLAKAVREQSGVATAVGGLITQAAQAEAIVASGAADLVMLARSMLKNPYWAMDAAFELLSDAQWPRQYRRALTQHQKILADMVSQAA